MFPLGRGTPCRVSNRPPVRSWVRLVLVRWHSGPCSRFAAVWQTYAACTARSLTTGTPNGRCSFVPGFGIQTLRAGCGSYRSRRNSPCRPSCSFVQFLLICPPPSASVNLEFQLHPFGGVRPSAGSDRRKEKSLFVPLVLSAARVI